ncbi:hypothetical protein V2J09_012989 [Rumex salicifolius]
MGEHLVLIVDRLVHPPIAQAAQEAEAPMSAGIGPVSMDSSMAGPSNSAVHDEMNVLRENEEEPGEEEPLIQSGECRICQEEDLVQNFEVPCSCSGSLKYAHRKCVQRWCNEKGDIICEICHQAYQSGYTAPPPHPEDTAIDIGIPDSVFSGGWTISGSPLDLHDPRLLAIAEAERQFLEAEYDEYAASSASGAAFCRSAFLILMALLLLRHALSIPDADSDDDTAFFSLFLLRAAGFLLPCYIMAWAINILQQRRQRQANYVSWVVKVMICVNNKQEAAALAATQVAFVLQSGQHRGLQFTIAPRPPTPVPQETA